MPVWNQYAPGNPETLFTNVSLRNGQYEHNPSGTSFDWAFGFPQVTGQYLKVQGSGYTFTIDDEEYHLNDTGTTHTLTIFNTDGYPVVEITDLSLSTPDLKSIILFGSTASLRNFILGQSWTFNGSAGADDITGGSLNDIFLAHSGNDVVHAGSGSDKVDGGTGADTLYGEGGHDVYYVDNAGDSTHELVGEGTDLVLASVNYALVSTAEIETLRTTDTSGTDALNLTGNSFAQSLQGNAGINRLDGGGGVDRLTGYAGNDTYIVDNAGDMTVEAAGQGTDKAITSVSYTLRAGAHVERLETDNASSTTALNLIGNEIGQVIVGNRGANILRGNGGADDLYSGSDTNFRDTFVFAAASDSGVAAGTIDRIFNFDKFTGAGDTTSDKIDLHYLDADDDMAGNQAFRFVTNFTAPTGTEAEGQVRLVQGSGYVSVEIDLNGDNTADMMIQVMSVTGGLSQTDFLL